MFENVDRLLKSPASQRGRDFGIILSCLNIQGYSVEWRVVNSAQYGATQRRKRTFVFAYRNDMHYKQALNTNIENIFQYDGFMAKAFPVNSIDEINSTKISGDLVDVSNNFSFDFKNAGYMSDGIIYTTKVTEQQEDIKPLRSILQSNVEEKYYISQDKIHKWQYLKGSKKIERVSKSGHKYTYSEGEISFPDSLDKSSRTILTSEGSINRSTHVIEDPQTKRLRILTPIEAERLQGFDDNWTDTGMPERMRYFCMGNALVVSMVTRMGKVLDEILDKE